MNTEILLQISNSPDSARPFCAGLVLDPDGVVDWRAAAPLLRTLLAGWHDIRAACLKNGWRIETVRLGNRQPAPRTPW
jgi:hypothetical protein